jgi:TetR/AcrR family transcriptional repressor of uid operon
VISVSSSTGGRETSGFDGDRGQMIDATSSATQTATLAAPGLAERILEGTVRRVAETGVTKTTIDDIAREAGCGRATVYRVFAGGRDAVLAAAGTREVERFLAELGVALDGCDSLEDALVLGITHSARQLHTHDALRYMVVNEPAVLRPLVNFDGLDPLLARAGTFAGLHLARFLDPPTARAVGEWAGRLIVAYACTPITIGVPCDLTDEDATRHLVRTFALPGIAGARRPVASAPAFPHPTQE